jgi:hypothetical protein
MLPVREGVREEPGCRLSRLAVVALFILGGSPVAAEVGFLVVFAKSINDSPVERLDIGIEGYLTTAFTDRLGTARLKLSPQTKANSQVRLAYP